MFRLSCICLFFCSFALFSQTGPRTWEDHLSINSCNTVTKKGNMIYASYRNGLIKFDEAEKSPETWNKINGLSDIGIRLLRANPYNNKLLVIYDNCNIDVIDANDNLKNYPDIKLKTLNGKKLINEVTFDKQYAYLACGFGIIVFDTDKLEIKDTYIIGANATNLEVNQLTLTDTLIFAATPIGIYKARRNTLLNNYKNWIYDTLSLPIGYYCGIVNVQGKILTCHSKSVNDSLKGQDSLYQYVNNAWIKYPYTINEKITARKLSATFENLFTYFDPIGLIVKDINTGGTIQFFVDYNGEFDYGTLQDSYISRDFSGRISYWFADARFGLNQNYVSYYTMQKVTRNGTNKALVGNIDVFKGKVAVSPSYIDPAGTGNYTREGINILKNKDWSYIPCYEANSSTPIMDMTSVLIDRLDTSVTWYGSWWYGVVKLKNNKFVAAYTPSNSAMPKNVIGQPRCSGLSTDKAGNIWFANSDTKNFLSVIKKDGTYLNFDFEEGGGFTRKTFVDKNNYVWALHERGGGLSVFKHVNFNAPQTNVNYKVLNSNVGTGNLQANDIYSIAEDNDGKIWVGTSAGISVIYNPTAIFNGGDYDAQPIKIVQDGNVELLLGKEAVMEIVVDGANNKWCGTQLGGVYCFSPDGLTQLYHFTKENSSLYSNTILDLNYDETTGDVFIGTESGLQSFRNIVVAGEQDFSNVYAYPNPVRPGYQGKVLIRGLVDECIVKIADESGNLVWETKSTGGQIEWPITTLSHVRVSSGVYLIYASTANGELKTVAKILVVN